MKKIRYIFLFIMGFGLFSSCEDVVDIDTPTEPPRLIIDALIRVDTSNPTTETKVIITQTSSFFDSPTPVQADEVILTNATAGITLPLSEIGPGTYTSFLPTQNIMEDEWFLQVTHDGELYVAFAEFVPSVPINTVTQGDGSIFDEDDTEVIINFTDEPGRDDFYLFDFDFGNFLATEDEFYQGQTFEFSYFYDDELEVGEQAEIGILGINQEFFNYMTTLIEQSEGGFGPFETPVVTLRGNFINAIDVEEDGTFTAVGDPDKFALGYFSISEEYKTTFVVQ